MNREQLLEKYKEPIKVGHLGFVKLIDLMGNDEAIVQAARVSYGAGTKTVSEDRGLIRYLTRHYHSTPTEMCEIKIHICIPNHVWKQMLRHRTASINETSTRYSLVEDDKVEVFAPELLRLQSVDNKQGSSGYMAEYKTIDENGEYVSCAADAEELSTQANEAMALAYQAYQNMIDAGVAREQARNVLPLATYTQAYWKIDLHNLFHFLRLRLDSHAQLEIREFAQAIYSIVKDWVPFAAEAFEDYRLNAISLSRAEKEVFSYMLADLGFETREDLKYYIGDKLKGRELKEFLDKFYDD